MKVGDRVRCTLGESVLVGVVGSMSGDSIALNVPGQGRLDAWISPHTWTVEVAAPALPPEPPSGTIMRTASGGVLQRIGDYWRAPTGAEWTWAEIHAQRAIHPLTLLIPATQVIEDVKALAMERVRDGSMADALAEKYGVTP